MFGVYVSINQAFKDTCRIVLGGEVGELAAYRPYLLEMVQKPILHRSSLSGQEVYLSSPHFDSSASFIGLEELKQTSKPFDINQIKDIDSLRQAIGEQYYCGNKNIGQCVQVEKADACTDCTNTLESSQMLQDKNVAYGYALRKNEGTFGCCWCGEVTFSIRAQGSFFSSRLFESYLCMRSTGLAFCMNCRDCTDSLFSFNQTAKHHLIGNRPLAPDQFRAIKAKLMAEVAEELCRKKRFPSLFELVGELDG